jgi:hypothetical protein
MYVADNHKLLNAPHARTFADGKIQLAYVRVVCGQGDGDGVGGFIVDDGGAFGHDRAV